MAHAPGSTLKALVKLPKAPADCWTWLGKTNGDGVPVKQFNGETLVARRWLWAQLFGPIPDGMVVGLSCGNKACMNPFHFRMGSQADAVRAGSGTSLLPADVAQIRAVPKEDRRQPEAERLAGKFGCSEQTIRDVWRRRSWKRGSKFPGPHARRNQHTRIQEAACSSAT